MYNKCFEYLLSNDPDDVISKSGILVRKAINPIYRKVIPFSTKNELIVERKEDVPKDKKIIYSATHGFRDDIVLTLKTIDAPVYLLYGSLLDFYYSIDGLALWLNGTIIVDRKDKKSRAAAILKMERALELGSNLLIYPEGVWNKEQSLIVQKLYTGIYDVAEKEEALVVPIATIQEGNKCYSIQGSAYDITNFTKDDCDDIKRLMHKNLIKCIDLIVYNTKRGDVLKQKLNYVLEKLKTVNVEQDISSIIKMLDTISILENEIVKTLRKEDDIELSIRNLLVQARDAKKIIAVQNLRDKMATLKWELYEEHRRTTRESFSDFDPIFTYWDNYLEELIKTANGLYDYEIEDTAEYRDRNEISDIEVFRVLDNVEVTKQNALVLSKTRNKRK
jgi:hypothetical protein